MNEDRKYHLGRLPDRTYTSRPFTQSGSDRSVRILYKVFDGEQHVFGTIEDELVLKERPRLGRVEIRAVLYEDDRQVQHITFLKYDDTNSDAKQQFSLKRDDLRRFSALLHMIRGVSFDSDEGQRFDDDVLKDIANLMSDDGIRQFLRDHPDIAHEIVEKELTQRDVIGLGYRKEQLEVFRQLLEDEEFFNQMKLDWKKTKPEDVWQHFFEKNTWVFGYGLQYIFSAGFESTGRDSLKQMIRGSSVASRAKEADALLRTLGLISSMCFVEIKRHDTDLLKQVSNAYRVDCWQISDELAGAIAQVQKVVEIAREDIGASLFVKDSDGFPTGEIAYLYEPKAFILVGSLREFMRETDVSKTKFGSFELFRRNLHNPEIITFDELYERAKHIVDTPQTNIKKNEDESHDESDIDPPTESVNDQDPWDFFSDTNPDGETPF